MAVTASNDRKPRKPRFQTIGRKDGLVTRVVQAIERQILDGRLPVGTRLPPERELAESLAVSRPVIREAVGILVTKGLLETRHGIGTTVRAVTHDEVTRPLTLFLRTSVQEVNVEHLHQVRSMLEVENAGLAATQRTDEDVTDLTRLCDEMQMAAEDPQRFALLDSEFHRRLVQTTHNPLMILLLDSIQKMTAEVRALVGSRPHLFERVMPSHYRILECVAAQDRDGARAAMREHLDIALAIQRELIESQATTA
jgi:GntR family transcriptional regulator, transcriptional repressor for pyruvate dehydrogenase complex